MFGPPISIGKVDVKFSTTFLIQLNEAPNLQCYTFYYFIMNLFIYLTFDEIKVNKGAARNILLNYSNWPSLPITKTYPFFTL
jgi:hypothetical protein